MTKNDSRPAPERADELVAIAATLFSEQGYEATPMQDIADRMGILKGSIYHYVTSKADLLWLVVEPPLRELVTSAEAILKDTERPLDDRLAAAIRAHAESFEAHYPHMAVMTREDGEALSDERRNDLDALRRRYFELWRETLVGGQRTGEVRRDTDPAIAVMGIFGMLNWMCRWFEPGGRMAAADVAEEFSKLLIAGLGIARA